MYKVTVYLVNGKSVSFRAIEPADEGAGCGETTIYWRKEHGDFVTFVKSNVLYFEEVKE